MVLAWVIFRHLRREETKPSGSLGKSLQQLLWLQGGYRTTAKNHAKNSIPFLDMWKVYRSLQRLINETVITSNLRVFNLTKFFLGVPDPPTSGGGRYFSLEELNDECMCNHTGSRGVWEHYMVQNWSKKRFQSIELWTTVVHYICNNLCCILKPNKATTLTFCQPSPLPMVTQAERAR